MQFQQRRAARLRARLAVVAIALAAPCLASATAQALTVSPTGTYTEVSYDMNLEVRSNGQRALCSTTTKQFTVDRSGVGAFALGAVTFSGCWNPLIAGQRLTQTAAWALVVTLLTGGGIAMTITVPTHGLYVENLACRVWLGGTITKLAATTSLPASATTFSTSATTLRMTRVDTPFCGAVNLDVGMYLTLTLDRAMTVSG